jgi:NTP pyrophosphatase (non-canonical NTP hydrolase)
MSKNLKICSNYWAINNNIQLSINSYDKLQQLLHHLFLHGYLIGKLNYMSDSKLFLKESPRLKDFQDYVKELETERGFEKQDVIQKCLLLGEEIGELFKAVRKMQSISIDKQNSKITTVEEELADILIYLCAIANRYNIDLEEAFRKKEEINKDRVWS